MTTYYNLTQCTGERMCYLRSTDIEQKNWKRLLWSFPDEMLYFMSQGEAILIVDKSKREKGKIERIFVPVMNDLLNWLYCGITPKNELYSYHLAKAKLALADDVSLNQKFWFWRDKIKKIELYGETEVNNGVKK